MHPAPSGKTYPVLSNLFGRWDLVVDSDGEPFPSWVELAEGGGWFVGRFGSARPLVTVEVAGDVVRFALPPQYEARRTDLVFEGRLVDGWLIGTTTLDNGEPGNWSGTPAPALERTDPHWGDAEELVSDDLSNWRARSSDLANNWSIKEGMLVNSAVGSDLISTQTFNDFRLVAEYRYPKGSNSGIYLRGRYEFQIVDDFEGGPHDVGNSGAIYGFLAPTHNAIKPPDEWNTAEIELIGRFITVTLNGDRIIDGKEIPGITGGALDSAEGEPGPIFVQGDHGPVTFRRLSIQRPK